jgi:hypothetical protein
MARNRILTASRRWALAYAGLVFLLAGPVSAQQLAPQSGFQRAAQVRRSGQVLDEAALQAIGAQIVQENEARQSSQTSAPHAAAAPQVVSAAAPQAPSADESDLLMDFGHMSLLVVGLIGIEIARRMRQQMAFSRDPRL